MKVKKFKKKLGLNKSTVSNLNLSELKLARGGGDTDECETWTLGTLCQDTAQCPATETGGGIETWVTCGKFYTVW